MLVTMEQTVYKWLRSLKLPISRNYLFELLTSHPDYPSLLSITDVLDGLGIENITAVIDKASLGEIDTPLLAHMQEGEFRLIKPGKSAGKSADDFYTRWDGIVLAAEATSILNEAGRKAFAKQRRRTIFFYALLASALTFTAMIVLSAASLIHSLLIVSDVVGVVVAVLIVRKDMGISDGPEGSFCFGGDPDDCNAVIRSTTNGLPSWIRWSDAGLIFFTGHFFLLTLPAAGYSTAVTLGICRMLAVGAMLFVVYSIYYQWRVLRKWCFLCLVTCCLLCFQFFCLSGQDAMWGNPFTREGMAAFCIFFTVMLVWLLSGPVIKENTELRRKIAEKLRFKNDVDTFLPLAERQRRVDTSPFMHELEMGKPGAQVQVLVGCNPYCNPCARAHRVLHGLAERFEGRVSIVTRFDIKLNPENDRKCQAAGHILTAAFGPDQGGGDPKHIMQVLDDWFSSMNAGEFCKAYGISSMPVFQDTLLKTLELHQAWSEASNISFTPTIFINGCELPEKYSVDDLPILIQGLVNDEFICANKVYEPGTLNPGQQVQIFKTLQ